MIVKYNYGSAANGFQEVRTIIHLDDHLELFGINRTGSGETARYNLYARLWGPVSVGGVLASTENTTDVDQLEELKRKLNYFMECLENDFYNETKSEIVCDLTVPAPM